MSERSEQWALDKAENIILYGYVANRDAAETARKVREIAFPSRDAEVESLTAQLQAAQATIEEVRQILPEWSDMEPNGYDGESEGVLYGIYRIISRASIEQTEAE